MTKIIRGFIYFLLIIIPFLLITNAYFLIDPPIWPDEPVFFEMSQNLIKTGKLTTGIYGGGNSLVAETALGYPPLYYALQGAWTGVFGITIEVIRTLSVILAIGTLIIFFLICRNLINNKIYSYAGVFLLSLNIYFLRASRLGRMEILGLFLILFSFFLLLRFFKQNNAKSLLGSGLFAGLASITHPLGFMAPAIMSVCLLAYKSDFTIKIKYLLLFLSPVIVLVSIWMLTSGNNPLSYLQTYQVHMQDKAPKTSYLLSLFNQSFTWRSFFVSELVIFLLLIFTTLKDYQFQKLCVLIALITSFIFAYLGKENGYILYFQPYIILALLFIIQSFKKYQFVVWKIIIILVAFFFIFDSLKIQFLENDSLNINKTAYIRDYNYFASQILSEFPVDKKLKIFISSVPDPYFILVKNPNLSFIEAADPNFPISDNDYKKILDSCDYIFATWFPHKYLSDYIKINSVSQKLSGQERGYTGVLFKLKTIEDRE